VIHYDGLIVVPVDNIDCSCDTELGFYILSKFQDQETCLCNFVEGGKAAATTSSVSAATIAKALSGIDFPKSKSDLKEKYKKYIKISLRLAFKI
jgi:hypothetical protein